MITTHDEEWLLVDDAVMLPAREKAFADDIEDLPPLTEKLAAREAGAIRAWVKTVDRARARLTIEQATAWAQGGTVNLSTWTSDQTDVMGVRAVEDFITGARHAAKVVAAKAFDDADARTWAEEWAASNMPGVSNTITGKTKEAIDAIVERARVSGQGVTRTAKQIKDLGIGLHKNQAIKIMIQIEKWEAAGATPAQLIKRTKRAVQAALKQRATLVARTEIMTAANEGSWTQMKADFKTAPGAFKGIRRVWLTAVDAEVCPICIELEDEHATINGAFPGGFMNPPAHPACLPGDSLVLSGSAIAAYSERWLDGDVVVIGMAGGRKLTCTPNHPILTPSGWVAAGVLDVGSHVVCDGRSQWRSVRDGDHEQMPAGIQDLSHAAVNTGMMTPMPVPVSAEDFHGDGLGSEIAIVWTDRQLRDGLDTSITQHANQSPLVVRGEQRVLTGAGLSDARLAADDTTTIRSMSGAHLSSALCERHATPLQSLSVALATRNDVALVEASSHDAARDAELARQLIHGQAIPVFLDEIVYVERQSIHGFVYNLETVDGWYSADGIVTHNCRCSVGLEDITK